MAGGYMRDTMIVGIDLVTPNSLISVWRDGEIVLIPNALVDDVLTPSAVSINDDDHVLVGRAARDVCLTRPECGAVAFKRHMESQRPCRLGSKQGFRP